MASRMKEKRETPVSRKHDFRTNCLLFPDSGFFMKKPSAPPSGKSAGKICHNYREKKSYPLKANAYLCTAKQNHRKLMIQKKIFTLCLLLALLACGPMQADTPQGNLYLTPQRLFHIARSINRNLVCYDANLVDGKLDTDKPLNVYWVNREERMGEKNGLSFFQRKMAYGYKVVAKGTGSSTVTLTAYSGRRLEIIQQESHCICRTTINGKPAILKYLYVKVSDHNPLGVDYVELHGVTLAGNEEVAERIMR